MSISNEQFTPNIETDEEHPWSLEDRLSTLQSGLESFGALADQFREQPEETGKPAMESIFGIYDALLTFIGALQDAYPEHAVAIVEYLAMSEDVNTRCAAVDGISFAYHRSPEEARDVISRLLTDPDDRVRSLAHYALSSESYVGEDPATHRSQIIDLGYIASLPVETMAVTTEENDRRTIRVSALEPVEFYPGFYGAS